MSANFLNILCDYVIAILVIPASWHLTCFCCLFFLQICYKNSPGTHTLNFNTMYKKNKLHLNRVTTRIVCNLFKILYFNTVYDTRIYLIYLTSTPFCTFFIRTSDFKKTDIPIVPKILLRQNTLFISIIYIYFPQNRGKKR